MQGEGLKAVGYIQMLFRSSERQRLVMIRRARGEGGKEDSGPLLCRSEWKWTGGAGPGRKVVFRLIWGRLGVRWPAMGCPLAD